MNPDCSAHRDGGSGGAICDQAWQIVVQHDEMIERIVAAAISRRVIQEEDREDAISEARLLALELAERPDVRNFEHLLANTLHHRFMDKFRPGTDAMDWVVHERDNNSGADAMDRVVEEQNNNSVKRGVRPLRADLTLAEIHRRINSRIPERYQPIARMALIEHLSVTKIAHRTGRSRPGPKAELRKIITYCTGRVYGREKKARHLNVESMR